MEPTNLVQIESVTTPPPTVAPSPAPSSKSNKIILILLGFLLVGAIGVGAFWLGKSSGGPKIVAIPTSEATPTIIEATPTLGVLATPTPDPTVGWKTYTNGFAKFTLKFPPDMNYSEKSFSDKEKQVIFSGR